MNRCTTEPSDHDELPATDPEIVLPPQQSRDVVPLTAAELAVVNECPEKDRIV